MGIWRFALEPSHGTRRGEYLFLLVNGAGYRNRGFRCWIFTIVANDIVHVARGGIAITVVIKQQGCATDAGDTTEGTQASRTTTYDDDIVIGLWDGLGGCSQQRQGEGEEGCQFHGDGQRYDTLGID